MRRAGSFSAFVERRETASWMKAICRA
jgi:hypothetical protein